MSTHSHIPITIWSTSDLHGFRCTPGHHPLMSDLNRMHALARMIEARRRELGRSFFWFDNGDAYQGAPLADYIMSDLRNGEARLHPMTEWFRQSGCDAFVPGNHEFNYGQHTALRLAEQFPAPWLSANIVLEDTNEPLFGTPYRIWTTEEGARIALLGLTTSYIPAWEQPAHIEGLRFLSAVETAKRYIPLLREEQKADVVIVSYHGGFEADPDSGTATEPFTGENEGYRLCTELNGIDVLLTGHQHRQIEGVRIGHTPVLQPGSHGSNVAEAKLLLQQADSGRWTVASVSTRLIPVDSTEPASAPEWLRPYEADITSRLNRPLGRIIGDMRIRNPKEARRVKHPFVQWLNEAQMEAAGVDVSLTALMDDHAPGFGPVVTDRDIAANYPYPNTLAVLRLNGRQVKEALERSACYFTINNKGELAVSDEFQSPKPQPYNYDMWEGITYTLDISRPLGERVTELLYRGQPLSLEQELDVVMNHYRANGGGGYDMFIGAPVVKHIHREVIELLAEALYAKPEWHARLTENWRVIGQRGKEYI
ncbi:bifunctional UDP-sugar hydrolase/5'-nucleotidase [Paenibacillus sp. PL2-23]|uniref:bifunctional metallophosphatase/5'-nucleotidase n=1 Tax=Paenibacillus sp. PL2-23 TaxID=2100729 RepID=UPI0030FCD2EF